ncbi:MAG: flagellar assembly protein FliW [Angustibacter sp.]|uniref:flagellar assembly protein FliW n=1 Tax=Angustibacter sp. Root456 TaxID=1736539 RepID=UPI0009EB1133|nr:flagellar assembly protein FliW [Angustibacter sp. Root456]
MSPEGTAPMDDDRVIEFADALPGLPGMSRCLLVELGDSGSLFRLRSVIDPDLQLVVAAPSVFFADYAPEIDDETAALIGLERAEDALLLVVVTVGASLAESTANLLAPIVVNQVTRRAVQVVQPSPDLPLQAPLVAA